MARPECAGLLSRSGYVRSGLLGSWSLRHKDPLHILLYPGHCGDAASTRHTTPVAAPQLNAPPVTGSPQCQFSCWGHSGARPGLHSLLSKGSGDPLIHLEPSNRLQVVFVSYMCECSFQNVAITISGLFFVPPMKDFCTQYLC